MISRVLLLVGVGLAALLFSNRSKTAPLPANPNYLLPKGTAQVMKTPAFHKISEYGKSLIKKHEGLHDLQGDGRIYPYNDPVGIPTIGYGHVILPGENFHNGITKAQAELMLDADISKAHHALVRQIPGVPLTQGQYDALISFVFNLGEGRFRDSTLRRKLLAMDYEGASQEFSRWVNAGGRVLPGLVARRNDEARTFTA